MNIVAQLMGIAIAGFALVVFVAPKITEKVFDFFMEGKSLYLGGVIRIVVGLILLLSISSSAVPLAAGLLGVIFLASGAIIFATELEKMKEFLTAYRALPEPVLPYWPHCCVLWPSYPCPFLARSRSEFSSGP